MQTLTEAVTDTAPRKNNKTKVTRAIRPPITPNSKLQNEGNGQIKKP